MKNLFTATLTVCSALLLSSCGTFHNSNFSRAKYLDGQDLVHSSVKTKPKENSVSSVRIINEVANESAAINEGNTPTAEELTASTELTSPVVVAEQRPVVNFLKSESSTANNTVNIKAERPTLKQRIAIKAIKKAAERNASARPHDDDEKIIMAILCFVLPPLAVYIKTDDIGTDFWISVILTLLFWLPGIIWAIYVCFIK